LKCLSENVKVEVERERQQDAVGVDQAAGEPAGAGRGGEVRMVRASKGERLYNAS
jgi:hypothetical protein